MRRLKKWPERTDMITAYGCDDEIEDQEVLFDFYNLLAGEKDIKDDMINAFIQLYSLEYNFYYEGIYAFYNNSYGCNSREQIFLASEWFKCHDYEEIGEVMLQGFDENRQEYVSNWVYEKVEYIYSAYRYIMILFEQRYLEK